MEVFLLVHPSREGLGHLVGVVVEIFAVERLADIDPDLAAVETVERVRLLGCSGPDLVSACDVDGNHGNAGLDGEVSGTVLHLGEFTGVGTCAFGEDEADVAFLDFLLSLDETSDGVAVAVDCDASADSHDETSEFAVVCLKVGSCEAAHIFEMSLREIVDDKNAVGVTLVVGCDNVGIVLGEILSADTFHVAEKVSQEEKSVFGYYVPKTSFGRIFLIQVLMMICF